MCHLQVGQKALLHVEMSVQKDIVRNLFREGWVKYHWTDQLCQIEAQYG